MIPMTNVTPSHVLTTLCEQSSALVGHLSLREEAIPDCYSHLFGSIRGTAVELHTRRFSGGVFRSLTIATIRKQPSGELCSLTVVGLPTPSSLLPILGVDLIALQGSLSLIAIDLSPTDEAVYTEHASPILESLAKRAESVTIPRKRPTFCHDTFSPLALICAARPGHEAQVEQVIAHFLSQVITLCAPSTRPSTHEERSRRAWQQQRAWLLSEQANRKEANALSLMFGEPIASRYLQEFLFEVPHE